MFRIRSRDVPLVLAGILVVVAAAIMYLSLQNASIVHEALPTSYQSSQVSCPTPQESVLTLIRRYLPLP